MATLADEQWPPGIEQQPGPTAVFFPAQAIPATEPPMTFSTGPQTPAAPDGAEAQPDGTDAVLGPIAHDASDEEPERERRESHGRGRGTGADALVEVDPAPVGEATFDEGDEHDQSEGKLCIQGSQHGTT